MAKAKAKAAAIEEPTSKLATPAQGEVAATWEAVESLVPWARNPRNITKADIREVAKSIRRFGFGEPLVARLANRELIAGHTRQLAAKSLGMERVPVRFMDISEDEAHALAIADNKLGELVGWNNAVLGEILGDMAKREISTEGLGFAPADLHRLIRAGGGPVQDDPVPPVPKDPVTKLGDVIELGDHRLVCGNSTDPNTYEALLADDEAGSPIDMVWSDPPYGVSLNKVQSVSEAKARRRRLDGQVIENDDITPDELRSLLKAALGLALDRSKPGAVWYIAAPAGDINGEFCFVLGRECLNVWRHTLIWVKDRLVLGRADYHYRHEPVFYGWKAGAAHHQISDRQQDTVWEIPRPSASPEHPTMKPVELVARAIRNSSAPGDIVLDMFGGSGTTLIACEHESRRARLVELSPGYCDVIVTRWEALTGKRAVRRPRAQED